MGRKHPRRPAGQLSIRQMLVLVAYSAVVCAFAMPTIQTQDPGWRNTLLMFDAIALPMGLSVLSLVLLRDGPVKDRLVMGFMCLAVLAMLGVVDFYIVKHAPREYDREAVRVPILAANLALLVPTLYLGWRAIRPSRPRSAQATHGVPTLPAGHDADR